MTEKHINSMSNKDDERLRKTTIAFLKDFAEQGYENAVECIDWLEKQREQKSIDDLTQQEAMDIAVAKCFEQGKRKPTDKVEPKFKDGDWIASDNNNVAYIESISETKYNLRCKDGYHEKMSIEYIDRCWHLWTIRDAKKGDMLSNGNIVLIFDSIGNFEGKEVINSWYFTDSNKFYGKGPSKCDQWEIKSFRPASKAEKNYLFKMMYGAGYEWDAEKKEPRKIEQKPITPKFRVGDKVHLIKGTSPIYEDDCLTIGEISNGTYYGDTKDGWFNIEDQDRYELVEQKPVDINPSEFNLRLSELLKQFETLPKEELVDGLSFYLNIVENDGKYVEEQNFKNQEPVSRFDSCIQNGDKVIYNEELGCRVNLSQLKRVAKKEHLTDNLEAAAREYATFDRSDGDGGVDLTSLRAFIDGAKWQKEQKPAEWSEEDGLMLDETLFFIQEFQKSDRCKNENDMQNSITCENWLKSLKDRCIPQPNQKWSEEDETALNNLISALANDRIGNNRDEYVDWLKSLKQRMKKL